MSEFTSVLDKYGKKYGINTNVGSAQKNGSTIGSGEFASVVAKYDKKYNFVDDVKRNRRRYDTDPNVDTDYVNQYLSDHQSYWSGWGAGKDDADNPNYRLDERRASIDSWLDAGLADGSIDQEWYDQVQGILGEADSNVGFYQGQRELGSYVSDWYDWYNTSAGALDTMDWETGRAGGTALDEGLAQFADRDAAAREWLETNRAFLGDEYYNAMLSELDSFGGYVDSLRGAYDQNAEYFSQWGSQEEHDQYVYLSDLDVGTETSRVSTLESVAEEMEQLERYIDFPIFSEEDQAWILNRYKQLQRRYGASSEEVLRTLETAKRNLDEATELQASTERARLEAGWLDKYAGMSYFDLGLAMDELEDGAEKQWLQTYAPTTMTDADYGWEIGELNTQIYPLEKSLEDMYARRGVLQQQKTAYGRSHTVSQEKKDAVAEELEQLGADIAEAEAQLEAMKRKKWTLEKEREYRYLNQNEDYELMSQVAHDEATADGKGWWSGGDAVYDYINFLDGTKEDHWVDYQVGNAGSQHYRYDHMTDDERSRYNYLYNKDGKERAEEYLEYLKPSLDQRVTQERSAEFADLAASAPLAADALSVVGKLMGGLGIVDISAQELWQDVTGEYKPINYYGTLMQPTHSARAIRETRVQNITDKHGVIQLDEEKHPILSTILNGRGLADVYQLGMSALDSKAAALTGNPAVAAALLASSTATDGVLDALERGATDEQALQMGLMNGVFEFVFEKWEVGELLKGDPSWVKAVVNQAVTEGAGEGFTSMTNMAADLLIMADKAQLMQDIAAYEADGTPHDQAVWKALADAAVDIGWDMVGGAASGGFSAGGKAAIDHVRSQRQYSKLPFELRSSAERLQSYGLDKTTALDRAGVLYELGQKYGEQAKSFQMAYDPKQDVYGYAKDFGTAWEIGRNNGNREYLQKLTGLSESQRRIAHGLGVEAQRQKKAAGPTDAREEKAAPETGYSVSEDGKAIDTGSGEMIEIEGFKSVGRNAELTLKGGKVIAAKDVSYASADEAVVYETIGKVSGSAEAANNLLKTYRDAEKSGMSASDFAAGLTQAYELGFSGQVAERQLGSYELAGKLSVYARSAAYSHGKRMGDIRAAARDAQNRKGSRKKAGAREGKLHFDRKGRSFSKTQEASLGALEALSKALGVDIYVYESYTEGGKRVYQSRSGEVKSAPNGFYDEQGIHIDLNAGNFGQGTMMFTAAHELTHFIKEWSPVKFRKLADLLVSRYAEQGTSVRDLIDNQITKAKKNGRTIDRDTAFEEVVADSMETMLTQGDAASFMADLQQKDKTLWEKVKQWFKDLAEKLRGVVDAYKGYSPETPEGRIVAQMEDFIGVLQEAYAEALVDAGERYRASEGNKKTTREGGEMHSFRGYDEESGRGIYEGNFPKGTPKSAKASRILSYIQNVWSKKPIALMIRNEDGSERKIFARFDPTYDEKDGSRSDASKLMGGNRHGSSSEQRVTLDLADDYYQIASESVYNYSKPETGKDSLTHKGVQKWHYFINDILFQEQGETEMVPYRVTINVKEKLDGNFVYSFNAERQEKKVSTHRTLHADVTSAPKSGSNAQPSDTSIRNAEPIVNPESTEKLSDRDPTAAATARELEKQGKALEADVENLVEMLRLQGDVTRKDSNILSVARYLSTYHGVIGSKQDPALNKELAGLLKEFYSYLDTGKNLSWEQIAEKAKPVTEWIFNHTEAGRQRSEYARNVLAEIRSKPIRLTEEERVQAAEEHGGYEAFRKKAMGSIVLSNQGTALEDTLQEWSRLYPGAFDMVLEAENKPKALMDMIRGLRTADTSAIEYAYIRDMTQLELARSVYDSFWRMNTVETVKTKNDKAIGELRRNHRAQMTTLQQEQDRAVDNIRKERKASLEQIRNEYRSEITKAVEATKEKYRERQEKTADSRNRAAIRNKIRAFKKRMEDRLLHPTDSKYVPEQLARAIIEVCELIDTDTDLYKADGTINKAQQRRNLAKEKLGDLKDAYEKLSKDKALGLADEYDQQIDTYLGELKEKYAGKQLSDMSTGDLNEFYSILTSIEGTLRDAKKLIGWTDAQTVRAAGDAIIAEQSGITKSRKNGSRNAAQTARDRQLFKTLSPMRNVERMSAYHQNSYLLGIFKKLEEGVRRKNKFVMDAYKGFEALASGKEYDDALYNEYGKKKYTDVNGKKFGVSKMQMMQVILSMERETANGMKHIEKGGFTFADLALMRKGNVKEAISEEHAHRVANATALAAEFQEALKNDKWCQEYMKASRKFFNETAKNAINETMLSLKHRIIARDKNYIPFEVDKNFVTREVSAENDIPQTINSYGMLKETKKGAAQPLIITGLNNVIDRHIDRVGNVYGLAVPVRNFNKVWNAKTNTGERADPTVKAAIQRNWGNEGVKHIEQAVQDIQGPRIKNQSELYQKVKSGYIGSTFALNLSVVSKQIGSMYSATSMLRWRDPVRMTANLLQTMVMHKKIAAEVDKYTATAWMRRQGMSDAELHTLLTRAKRPGLLKFFDKAPAILNPAKWITAMDHAVALSLWKYAKQDTAKRTKLEGEALLVETAKFYDDMIESTQSMSDMLHRPEIQKSGNWESELFGTFKTDLYQMAGQLQNAAGRYSADKSKDNAKALTRTAYGITRSILWTQMITILFAMIRYKMDPYRDEKDKDITLESFMKRVGFQLAGEFMGYLFPMFGGEAVDIAEAIAYGEKPDTFDIIALSAVNDLVDVLSTVAGNIKDGEMPDADDIKKVAVKALQLLGVPANNIVRTIDAIKLHAEDIANGQFLSFEAGADRGAKNHIYRVVDELDQGNTERAQAYFDQAVEEIARDKAKGGEYGTDEIKEAKSQLKSTLGTLYKDGLVTRSITEDMLREYWELGEDDVFWTFDKWDYAMENGTSDGYQKNGKLYAAALAGEDISGVMAELVEHGKEEKDVLSEFKSEIGVWYTDEESDIRITRDQADEMLQRYLGLDAEEAETQLRNWDFEVENGYGLDDIRQTYLDEEITAAEARAVLMGRKGDTQEEADRKIAEWDFEKTYDFPYSDRRQGYAKGKISSSDLLREMMEISGYTKEQAKEQLRAYDWLKNNPGYDMSVDEAIAYTRTVEALGKSISDTGIRPDVFLDYRDKAAKCKGTDSDGDGKTDSGSKKEQLLAVIDKLPISSAQKDALYYLNGWAKSKLWQAPWH